MAAFPEFDFEILNKKQLDFILSLLRFCITNDCSKEKLIQNELSV